MLIVMHCYFERKYGKFGVVNVCLLKSGVFIVQFSNVEGRAKMMDEGPCLFDNKPIVVKSWSIEVSLERDGLATVPIWIKLPGLRLHFWAPQMLSKTAIAMGKPFYTDMMTTKRSRLAYARICVEICLNADLPKYVMIKDPSGSLIEHAGGV